MIKQIINAIYPISTASISKIEEILTIENIEKGRTFIKRKKSNTKEYFVLDGICRSYLVNPEGKEISISFFMANSILSPHSVRTKNGTSLYNFQALSDVRLASMEKKRIENLEMRRFGNAVLQGELIQKIDKEIGLASLSAKERLLKFREKYPMLENQISHKDIASYLGITTISLSRLRKDLTR